MNFWQEKPEFWRNKTLNHETYAKQGEEVAADLIRLIKRHDIDHVVDVGGYKGRIGEVLDQHLSEFSKVFGYTVLDIVNGFDVTKTWSSQGYDFGGRTLCFTSLTLICFPPDDAENVIAEMLEYADFLYLFEEKTREDAPSKVNDDFGGKWNHDWKEYFTGCTYSMRESTTSPAWVKIEVVSEG
jgi:hypothetical protein